MEHVVGASEATMSSLLTKLGGLLAQEYALIRGVRGDIHYITDELTSMQAFIRDLTAAPDGHDHRVKDWMKQIRDVIYDIEDCIDDSGHLLSYDPGRDIACCSFLASRAYEILTWWPRRNIASNIAELKMRAQQIGERRIRYGVDNPPRSGNNMRSISGFDALLDMCTRVELVGVKELVGVEDDMAKLAEWVTDKDIDNSVLSIFGPGGVGKTTIATALYRKFSHHFDCRAMVTLSKESHHVRKTIFESILHQVKPRSKTGDDLRGDSLRTIFMSNSYFLLIEDVWSREIWEEIRSLFPRNQQGFRIVVTTRFEAVAIACREKLDSDRIHRVDVLRGEKPEKLFKKVVSEATIRKDGKERQIVFPRRVWEMCSGLPLAIVTMAGHVACNPEKDKKHWIEVCKNLVQESEKYMTQEGIISRILGHCYNDMTAELRTCSLYLSMFPKGSVISRKWLTRQWITEGFVREMQGLSMDDVAEACFNHLVRRKIIRPVEYSINGKVKNFQVHEMVLGFLVSKATEEKFVTVVGGHWLLPPPSSKVRRLSLQSGGDSERGTVMDVSHVRSLTMFGSMTLLPSNSLMFPLVQVLDLRDCKGFKQHHTKAIGKMLLVKYLGLRNTDIEKLPKKIGKLQYIETLDVRETNVTELPKSICQLERLVSILGGSKRTGKGLKLPENVNRTMKTLRILSGIEIDRESTADFHHMVDLRKLAIYKINVRREDIRLRDLMASIEYLSGFQLHTLVIYDDSSEFLQSLDVLSSPPLLLTSLKLYGKLVRLPGWITYLQVLTKLTLPVTTLSVDNLNRLGQLRSLVSLTFWHPEAKPTAILEENMEILVPEGGFEKLKLLRLFAPCLTLLSFQERAIPNLETLELRFSTLEGLSGIQNLQFLQEVHLHVDYRSSEVAKSTLENIVPAAKIHDKGPRIIVHKY